MSKEQFKIAILGQSQFAANVYSLLKSEGYQIVGVFTIPDKNGLEEPIAIQASQDGVKVFKHKSWRRKGVILSEVLEQYKSVGANLNVMPLCPQFIPMEVIESPRHRSISYHPSLLPRHRGASAVSWTLIEGDSRAGFTIFWADEGLDTGPILLQRDCEVQPNDTKDSLLQRFLLPEGAKAMVEAVNMIANGTAPRAPQPEEGATFDAFLNKSELCRVDLNQSAQRVHNFIRGLEQEPGSWIIIEGEKTKVFQSSLSSEPFDDKETKSLVVEGSDDLAIAHPDGLFLKCGDGKFVKVGLLQKEGAQPLPSKDCFDLINCANTNLVNHDELVTKFCIAGVNKEDDVEIQCDHFVNGSFRRGKNGMNYSVMNPSNSKCIHEIICASDHDITDALESAHKAFIQNSKVETNERFRVIANVLQLSDELAKLKALEQGALLNKAKDALRINFSQFHDLDSSLRQCTVSSNCSQTLAWSKLVGIGVCVLVIQELDAQSLEHIIISLGIGNSLVILSTGKNNLVLMKIAEMLKDCFNAGMLNVLTAISTVQEKLVEEHPLVTKTMYCNISRKTVPHIAIIFTDAELTKIVKKVVSNVCGNLQPMLFFVDSSCYDNFLSTLKEEFKQVKLGDSLDPSTQCGPLSSEEELNKLNEQIVLLQEQHAMLILGGKKDSQNEGLHYEPTIMSCKLKNAHTFKNLLKGPIAGISKWKSQDLTQLMDQFDPASPISIFTNNVPNALRLTENLSTDSCFINDVNMGTDCQFMRSDLISHYGKLKRVILNYA